MKVKDQFQETVGVGREMGLLGRVLTWAIARSQCHKYQ